MEAGRILKTFASEIKDFITHDIISSTNFSIFVLVPLVLKCHGTIQVGLEDACTCSGCFTAEEP